MDGLDALLQVRHQHIGMAQFLRRRRRFRVLRRGAALGAAHCPAGQLQRRQAAKVSDRSRHESRRHHELQVAVMPPVMCMHVGEGLTCVGRLLGRIQASLTSLVQERTQPIMNKTHRLPGNPAQRRGTHA